MSKADSKLAIGLLYVILAHLIKNEVLGIIVGVIGIIYLIASLVITIKTLVKETK